jgi:hypothetical protein
MRYGRIYFTLSLALLLVLCALALAAPFGKRQTTIEVKPGHYAVLEGHQQIVVFTLPLMLSLAVALGGLGSLQPRVELPEVLRGSAAWAFTAGVAFHGLAHFWLATNSGFEFDYLLRFDESRWIGFLGTVLLLYALLLSVIGSIRGRALRRLRLTNPVPPGGADMLATRIYAWGGLLILLWMVLLILLAVWPWRPPMSFGLSVVSASLFTYPLTIALGAVALLLSPLQPFMKVSESLKSGGALLYLAGTMLFWLSMFRDLMRDRPWDTPFSWPTSLGSALVLLALIVNFVGLLRGGAALATDSAHTN